LALAKQNTGGIKLPCNKQMLRIVKEYYKLQGDKTHSEHHVEVWFLLIIVAYPYIAKLRSIRVIKTQIVSKG
jgi:hypothetical protein